MSNNMPAFIVTHPGLTGLHISKLLTQKEYKQAQKIWGSEAFGVEKFSESLFDTLYAQFVKLPEFLDNSLLSIMNSPEYIRVHMKTYKRLMSLYNQN
jgi:hypothetical protein